MTYPEHYQDGGPSVEFYDLREVGGPGSILDGDVEFYLAQARRTGGPVLDVGCGTGRIAVPLAQAGIEVTGIDRAPGMIAIARAKQRESGMKNLRFVRADMTRFALPHRRFRLAVIAYRAFQHLLTPDAQRSCLTHIHRHLVRQGRLIVHLFDPRLEFCVPDSPPFVDRRPAAHDAATGRDVFLEVTDRITDPVTQTFSEIWRWRVMRNGTIVETHDDELRLRWTYRYEMRYLLELTGFKVVAEHSDFKGSPPRYGAEQVFTCVRL
jgi:ubiquinone/menaquinone biosynthesis C-methylase UbiE